MTSALMRVLVAMVRVADNWRLRLIPAGIGPGVTIHVARVPGFGPSAALRPAAPDPS